MTEIWVCKSPEEVREELVRSFKKMRTNLERVETYARGQGSSFIIRQSPERFSYIKCDFRCSKKRFARRRGVFDETECVF